MAKVTTVRSNIIVNRQMYCDGTWHIDCSTLRGIVKQLKTAGTISLTKQNRSVITYLESRGAIEKPPNGFDNLRRVKDRSVLYNIENDLKNAEQV